MMSEEAESPDKPACKYASKCYRKNPSHFAEFSHPERERETEILEPPVTKKQRVEGPSEDEIIVLDNEQGVQSKPDKDPLIKSKLTITSKEHMCAPMFYLTKVRGLNNQYNSSDMTIGIKDILAMGDIVASVQFNYLFDIDWMIQQYPESKRTTPILVVIGDKRETVAEIQRSIRSYPNIKLLTARLDGPFGTHHSKMMLLQYPVGIRVVVHTANLIHKDWDQKTQGVWISPVFQKIKEGSSGEQVKTATSGFKEDLIAYLEAYRISGLKDWIKLLKEHDMSSARVRLIGSVPGAHTGGSMNNWGHLKLKKLLKEHGPSAADVTERWPVIGQFSSIGSLGPTSQSWLCSEWLLSLSTARSSASLHINPPLKLVFPTVNNVRNSLEGYMAGGSIPYAMQTAQKQPYLTSYFHQWKAERTRRSAAAPHIKTYGRFSKDFSRAAWFLLTSANLSKAAWGGFEKKGTQLRIRSYEVGVLFLPSFQDPPLHHFEVAKSQYSSHQDCSLQVPYDVPLTSYGSDDEPWIWNNRYSSPDLLGNVWTPG